ncbi:hypothetical protein FEM48_Zijuj12G0019000 [Ziziphus jujuba var. spinosa]|uniref:Uncharacterized protein n=1 Tax=Ziziphus jujuba var. spinosa TaxID=714518 RepID=A0A978UAI7_ZIZJJ|nr:hypothetical protein FEM48_Zijuj12G0019000 [Ziziphus jujuba var. spinosa]
MEENEYVVSIEELHARKAVKRVESQAIGPSHDQNKKKAAVDSLKEKLKTLLEQRDNSTTTPQQPKIQRVVPMLRYKENFEKHYEPRAVSIGPIHHGKSRLQIAEKYKPKLVRKFIQDNRTDGEVLCMKVLEDIKELRNCYEEEVTESYDDESLAWIFFLDGCSTLQFIHSFKMGGELKQYFNIKNDQIAFAQQDLFLLENQLPYRLLKLLMNSTGSNCDEYKKSIKLFIGSTSTAPEKLRHKIIPDMDGKPEPAHLLDLLQSALLSQPRETTHDDDDKKEENYRRQSFRNIQELKEAGIQFKPSSTALIALALSSVQTWMAVSSWRSARPCDELCKNFTMHRKP